jgi:two-component system chemotaxis sensor kinase CheA
VEELFSSLVKDFVDETQPIAEEVGRLLLKLEQAWGSGEDDNPLLRSIKGGLHTIKGNAAMMGLPPIATVAHVLEDICAQAMENPSEARSSLAQVLIEGCDLVGQLIRSALSGDVDAGRAERFFARAKQVQEAALQPKGAEGVAMASPETAAVVTNEPAVEAEGRRGNARISDGDVDELLELTGETIVGQTELWRVQGRFARGHLEAGDVALMDQILTDLSRTARRMRDKLLRVRLAPIATLFQRYGRYLRDLAREREQPIELVIEGGETAVDRAIISRLFEPLVHLVRNAVAHGIEPVAERVAQGKPAKARVLLSARLREGRVEVRIADDGRGLDQQAIASCSA